MSMPMNFLICIILYLVSKLAEVYVILIKLIIFTSVLHILAYFYTLIEKLLSVDFLIDLRLIDFSVPRGRVSSSFDAWLRLLLVILAHDANFHQVLILLLSMLTISFRCIGWMSSLLAFTLEMIFSGLSHGCLNIRIFAIIWYLVSTVWLKCTTSTYNLLPTNSWLPCFILILHKLILIIRKHLLVSSHCTMGLLIHLPTIWILIILFIDIKVMTLRRLIGTLCIIIPILPIILCLKVMLLSWVHLTNLSIVSIYIVTIVHLSSLWGLIRLRGWIDSIVLIGLSSRRVANTVFICLICVVFNCSVLSFLFTWLP